MCLTVHTHLSVKKKEKGVGDGKWMGSGWEVDGKWMGSGWEVDGKWKKSCEA